MEHLKSKIHLFCLDLPLPKEMKKGPAQSSMQEEKASGLGPLGILKDGKGEIFWEQGVKSRRLQMTQEDKIFFESETENKIQYFLLTQDSN